MGEQARLLAIADVAALLGVSEGTVRNLVRAGELPPAVKVAGRLARWYREDVEAYLSRLRWSGGPPPGPQAK